MRKANIKSGGIGRVFGIDSKDEELDEKFKAYRPYNRVTGWWSGNSYESSERERLGFGREVKRNQQGVWQRELPCARCKETGKVTATKAECMYGRWGLFANSHWHSCKKACPACANTQKTVWVYLRKAVKNHAMGSRCKLIAIERAVCFDRCPTATITFAIGNDTHVVYSEDLSSPNDEVHRAMPNYVA